VPKSTSERHHESECSVARSKPRTIQQHLCVVKEETGIGLAKYYYVATNVPSSACQIIKKCLL
jgi:hypothetical protein